MWPEVRFLNPLNRIIKECQSRKALRKFRGALSPNQPVVVNNGKDVFLATIYRVTGTHVVVYNCELQFGAYGINCIFPKREG